MWLSMATGLDGTPMPSYDTAPEDELWDVVAYVRAVAATGQADARDLEEAQAILKGQADQARHAVVDGCGCAARAKAQQQAQAQPQPQPQPPAQQAPQAHRH
jgi:hypothetical protein